MADDKKATPTFVAKPVSELPKRETPKRTFNADAANALLAVVSQEGQTATDGATYPDRADASKKAASAKRLLSHVLPDGKRSRTRIYSTSGDAEKGPFAWAIFLADKKAAKKK